MEGREREREGGRGGGIETHSTLGEKCGAIEKARCVCFSPN